MARATSASPRVPCTVTPQRAQRFYERQQGWLQAKEAERRELRKEHIFRALQEEAAARKRECAPDAQPRAMYDRQMAWMQQRELDLEALRESYEVGGSRGASVFVHVQWIYQGNLRTMA